MLWYVVIIRLLIAAGVGCIIGAEREHSHHPAGLRTNILVCVGACAVMLTGIQLWQEAMAQGGNPDPARLGAQVISGIGFLGAGTIMKDNAAVRGLTTAAGLWTVACIGLAIGAGYYIIGLFSTFVVITTLTIVARFRKGIRHERVLLKLVTVDVHDTVQELKNVSKRHRVQLSELQFHERKGLYHINVTAKFETAIREEEMERYIFDIGESIPLHALESMRV